MLRDATSAEGEQTRFESTYLNQERSSGVSWGAVVAGAFVSAAFYLILLPLGAGMGLSSVSPWANVGMSAAKFEMAAVVWLIGIEIVASGVGGYLTGRLRTKWASIHSDEVHFRDTANGFLSWAVALVITVTFLASSATSMVGSAAAGAGSDAPGTGGTTTAASPHAYFIDMLFRSNHPGNVNTEAPEAERIFDNALLKNQLPAADRSYLAGMISTGTGISEPEAEKRIVDVMTQAREAEDVTRKSTARLLLCIFFMLILGAFTASLAATVGGRHRDRVQAV